MSARFRGPRARTAGERGQVSIDLAAFLPMFLIAVLVLAHSVALVAAVDATNQAARDAARASSLGQSPSAAAADALPSWVRLESVQSRPCVDACVRVSSGVPIGLPGFMTITHVTITRESVFARHD